MRYEYIHGVPVAMSPRPATNHNIVAGNIYYLFRTFLHGKNVWHFQMVWTSISTTITV